MRIWVLIGSISGGLSVIVGAFGAHALRGKLTPRALEIYQTASHYQIIHALALVALGLFAGQITQNGPALGSVTFAGWAFTIGTILFSGSLYALALTDMKILGAITPLGGISFILGWGTFALAAWKTSS